jgi:hypothetical protein
MEAEYAVFAKAMACSKLMAVAIAPSWKALMSTEFLLKMVASQKIGRSSEMDNVMKNGTIINGIIKSMSIEIERGRLTWWVNLRHENGEQGFGGIDMEVVHLKKIFNTLDILDLEKLNGCPVRIVWTHTRILAIGNFIKNKWFSPFGVIVNFSAPKLEITESYPEDKGYPAPEGEE